MVEKDFQRFSAMLTGTISMWSNAPTLQTIAVWFDALSEHELSAVERAFKAHIKDPESGRFCPTPAHILAHLKIHDGRPTADEAWATAVGAQDESETIVWTGEAANAFAVAKPLLDIRDKVAARRAFIDAYERFVSEARATKQPVKWQLSEGHDQQKRAIAVTTAVELGRIKNSAAIGYEPLMLAHKAEGKLFAEMPPEFQEKWRDFVARMKMPPPYIESDDAIAKRETEAKKREAAERVAKYERPTA